MEFLQVQGYDLIQRHEISQTFYEVSRNNTPQFSIFHSIDEDGCEAWHLMPSKTALNVSQKVINTLGMLIEANDL